MGDVPFRCLLMCELKSENGVCRNYMLELEQGSYTRGHGSCKPIGETVHDLVDPKHLFDKGEGTADLHVGVVKVGCKVYLFETIFGIAKGVFHDDVCLYIQYI